MARRRLRSGAGVWRSSRYADNLKAWYKHVPRERIQVVATEELEQSPLATLASVTAFLGLPPAPDAAKATGVAKATGASQRYCLSGRHGVLADSASIRWHASRLDGNSEGGAGGGISECDTPADAGRAPNADGRLRYRIAPATKALLHKFFAPYNKKLFDLLGRKLEWD